MTAQNQARLSALYLVPYDDLKPAQRIQRMSLHALWMREIDDLIDSLNRSTPSK